MAFKIYTKTGDAGETGLFGGQRVYKHHHRIEAYGTIDELNSWIGLLRDLLPQQEQLRHELKTIQERLFTIGAYLATVPGKETPTPDLKASDIELLEYAIDRMDDSLPTLKNFILPGGHPTVSQCHIARCVCRKAERRVVMLHTETPVDPLFIHYLNRLSDYLFTLGRYVARLLDAPEVVWEARG